MFIVKMVTTGHTKTLSVPASLRRQMCIVRNDYFMCRAKNKNIIQYTRLTPSSIRDIKREMKSQKANNGTGK